MSVATIAAAIADPLIESASNAGWFGQGNYTDHSDWDVVPALIVGLIFVALHLWLRIRVVLAHSPPSLSLLGMTGKALGPNLLGLLPTILSIQIAALYVLETSEQLVVYGHTLGGTIWLGGPIAASVTIHAAVCLAVTFVAARALHTLAEAAIHLVQLVCTLARWVPAIRPAFLRRPSYVPQHRFVRILCSIGERAPPIFGA